MTEKILLYLNNDLESFNYDKRYINLGSWSFGNSQYGIWNGDEFHLYDWISGREIRDEHYRPIFEGKTDLSYEEWVSDQYLGYLRFRCGEEGLREGVRPPAWVLARPESSLIQRTESIDTRGQATDDESSAEAAAQEVEGEASAAAPVPTRS